MNMHTWQERAQDDEKYSSVIDPRDKSGLKAAYMKTVHQKALQVYTGGIRPGSKLLDFGCGSGRILEYEMLRPAAYYGVDIAPLMIQNAQNKWRGRRQANFYVDNGAGLPFAADTFDYVLSTWVFQHIIDDEKLGEKIAELARLLKPGGLLIFIEQVRSGEAVEMSADGTAFKKYRTPEQYEQLCSHAFTKINSRLLPGVGNGLFYRALNIFRKRFLAGLIPLLVITDRTIYDLFFGKSAALRNFYIGRKWIDLICCCKKQ